MNKLLVIAVLAALSFSVEATNNGCGNNCNPPSSSGNPHAEAAANAAAAAQAAANATGGAGGSVLGSGNSASSSGVVGSGNSAAIGVGGAGGQGGEGGRGGAGGSVLASGNSANDIDVNNRNNNANVGINGQSLDNVVSTDTNVSQSAVGSGNTTNVDASDKSHTSVVYERNAPPVFLGGLSATMSCAGGFNAGASNRNGSGAFGFTWISRDCRKVVIGREFVGIGMVDVACRIWKTSKGYKLAVKDDPSLADVDCTAKQIVAPAAVIAPTMSTAAPVPQIDAGRE